MKVLSAAACRILYVLLLFPFLLFSQDNALLFDGVDDHVSVAPGPLFDGTQTITFEAWINPSSVASAQTIASWNDGAFNEANITILSGGLLQLEQANGGLPAFLTGTIVINPNEWTHVAVVVTAGFVEFYINGVQEVLGIPLEQAGAADMFALGVSSIGLLNYGGLMDEVRIWDTNLDQAVIQNQMFTALIPLSHPNLVAYYQFDETTGTSLPDQTASGFDATLMNFPGSTDPNWQTSTALTERFAVTNIGDTGGGSLRQAIIDANSSGADNVSVDFNIGGAGPWTIPLVTDLPTITSPMTINGTSQPGWDFSSENMVTLDLSGVTNGDGFNILSIDVAIIGIKMVAAEFGILVNGDPYDNAVIRDNIFDSNNNIAINIVNGDNVTITGNHIGVSGDGLTGTTGGAGIAVSGCLGLTIGGDRTSGEGNHIAGSAFSSYLINIAGSDNVVIEGNLIGASIDGNDITTSRGIFSNTTDNITIGNASNVRRNYIAGIDDIAAISVSNGDQVDVFNNYIGIGLLDSHAIGNNTGNPIPGIELSSTTNFSIDGNVSSGNRTSGITIGGNSNLGSVTNNLVGVLPDGTTAFGNTTDGILISSSSVTNVIIGGSGNENIIAYNDDNGIRIAETSFGSVDVQENSIFCNTLLGIDVAGTPLVDPPVITSVTTSDIIGTSTAEDLSVIRIYQVDLSCNDNQGATFIGSTTVSAGGWTFSGVIDDTRTYVAVVNDGTNGSSEFSFTSGPPISPGGVFTNLVLWLKADAGTMIATGVSDWADQSQAGNDVSQGIGVNQPVLSPSGLNFQPVLTFDGTDDLSTTNTSLIGGGAYTKIAVSRVTTATGFHNILSAGGTGNHAIYYVNSVPTIHHGTDQLNSLSSDFNNSIIFSATYDDASTSLLQHMEGALTGNNAGAAAYTDPGVTSVGSFQGSSNMIGDIAEVVMFDTNISATDRRKIESYLAVKYGIFRDLSTAESYLASDGSTLMWDQSGFSGFLNDITVIGRDDASGLNQKQSQSANADRIVSMGIGEIAADNQSNSNSFSTDLSFLSWANDDGDNNTYGTTGVTGLSTIATRLERLWKVDKQGGDIGNLTIQFDLNGNSPPSSDPIDYKLLIDNDGVDFSDATIINADSYVSNVAEFSGVNFTDGQFFALGIRAPSFVVTNTDDSGEGSLRRAILDANNSSEETVSFNIPGGGPWTINLQSALPVITSGAKIDASTQPGWDMDTGQMVEIDGTSAGNVSAFVVQSANVEIHGFHITNMQGNNGSTGVGVYINGEAYDNFVIGGPNKGNVIGGGRFGISITSADGGVIQGNRIGTDMAGTGADGHTFHGIIMAGSFGTLIGGDSGAGEGNLISANSTASSNYAIEAQTSDNLDIFGNLIGTDRTGNGGLGNSNGGIHIAVGSDGVDIGSPTSGHANIISDNNGGFSRAGILIAGGTSVVVDSNIIGLNSTGTASLGNSGNGVEINNVSGAGMVVRNNTISANGSNGIELVSVSNALTIEDNFIGTDVSGEDGSGHGNLQHGIAFRNSSGANASNRIVVQRNTISGNGDNVTDNGINFNLTNGDILIVDNFIGVEGDGATPLGNLGEGIEINTSTTDVEIGGVGVENTISYNAGNGIFFVAGNNSNGNDILPNIITCNTGQGIAFGSTPLVDAPVITTISASSILGTSTATNSPTVHLYEIDPTCIDNAAVLVATRPVSGGNWSYFNTIDVTKTYVATVTDATNGISEFSTTAKLATAPADLAVYTSSSTEVTFEWTDSPDETSYILERADDFGFTSGVTTIDGTIPAGTVSYLFNAGSNQPYFFRLTAVNALGSSPAGIEFATTQDFPGFALDFNGTNQGLTATSPTDLPIGNSAFTIEAWVRPDNHKLNDGVVSWGTFGLNGQYNSLLLTAGETFAFGLKHTFNNDIIEYSIPDLSGEWHHVAVSYDGTTRTLYLDGVPLGSEVPGAQDVQLSAIGIASANLANFDGQLDEIKIWNIARSDFSGRFAPLQGNETGLIAYYQLDENTGTTAVDRSTKSNHASINFGPGSVPSTLLNKLVTNTNDSGAGSLRQAIIDANGTLFPVTIEFDLPAANDIIDVTSGPLPVLDGNITIDASTQTSWNFATGMIPTVRDNCACSNGLETANSANIEIYGLRISDFDNNGIESPILSGTLTVGAPGKENVIVNNGNNGIDRYSAGGFIAQGNHIGVEYNGVANGNGGRGLQITNGGSGAIIGGLGANEGNVISSNSSHGIFFNSASNNQILGNYVGTDHLGTALRANGQDGLFAGASSDGHLIQGNIFSGNLGEGLYFLNNSDNNIILSNKIGVDFNGDPMANGNNGIFFDGNASDNQIGGLDTQANDIGNNGGFGILFDGTTLNGNFYLVNSIHDNTSGGISHTVGANSAIVPPIITSATTTDVTGTGVTSQRIHLYVSDGNGQGETLLDSADVDGGGNWAIGTLSIALTDKLVATATNLTNGSSEFSTPFQEQETFTVITTNNTGAGSLREAITNANNSIANNVLIDFNIPIGGGGPWTISPSPVFPQITRSMVIDGSTQSNWDRDNNQMVVLSGSSGDGLSVTSTGVEIYGLKITGFNNGIQLNGSGSGGTIGDASRGNVINGSVSRGIRITGITDVIIKGNRIGTNYNGTSAVANPTGINLNTGAHSAIIGGPGANEGNLISGNSVVGISGGLSNSHRIEGNIIGLNISHNAAIPNGSGGGISITPTDGNTIVDNIISGNNGVGIEFGGSNHVIISNTIGTDLTGTADFGNANEGIRTLSGDYDNWQIGTGNPGEGNVIAFNGGSAVRLNSATQTGHLISENSIYENNAGISILLSNNGITAPNITSVTPSSVSVDGVANNDLIEVFKGDGNGQGQTFIGSAVSSGSTVTIGGLSQNIQSNETVVTTRIDISNNTSEFSAVASGPNNALDFDGSNDQVTIGNPTALQITGNLTIEAWFKVDGPQNLFSTIAGKWSTGGSNASYALGIYGGSLTFGLTSAGGDNQGVGSGSDYDDGLWHHAAGVWDGTTMRLYVDGFEVNSNTPAGFGTISNTSLNFIIGADASAQADRFFDGQIDEVRIWSEAMSELAIRNNMFNPLLGDELNLNAYYLFDEAGSTTNLPDQTANSNDGTFTGGAPLWLTSGAFTPLTPRAASDLFTTEVSASQIDLTWTVNSFTETGFKIERSDGNNTNFLPLTTVGAGASSYSDMSVSAGNGYFYRVIATNDTGDALPSNEKFGSTLTQPGNSLTLDGIDDAVIIPEAPENDFQDGDDFSIEVWVKTSSTDQGLFIVGKHLAGSYNGYSLVMSGTDPTYCNILGHVGFYVASFGTQDACSDIPINDGQWHHIVGTFDDGANEARLYIDGVLQTDIGTKFGTLDNSEDLTISLPNFGLHFDGEIDEVRLWDDVRTIGEIQSNLDVPLVGNEAGLVAYYKFDQDEGTDLIVPDRSINNNNGTWQGSGSGVTTPQWFGSNAFAPLAASGLFTTEVSASQIDLSWTDNATNETGYTVERSDGNNFSFAPIATIAANATSYSDNTVSSASGYFYRVIANAPLGDSNPSNEKFGSTITQPGVALEFDGVDDQVIQPSGSFTAYTFETWVKFEGSTVNKSVLKYTLSGNPNFETSHQIRTDASGHLVHYTYDGVEKAVFGTTMVNLDQWYHVAIMAENSGQARLFVNGVEEGTPVAVGTLWTTGDQIRFGIEGPAVAGMAGAGFFQGELDEVRIWDEARTQEEILANMTSPILGNEANLVAYYRFDQDEPTDQLLPDRSTNNNDGTWTDSGGGTTVPQWVASGAMDPAAFANNALDFNGTTDFVFLPNAIGLTNEIASTVEAWFRIDGNPADFQTIYSEENSGGATFYILRTVSNVVQFGVFDGSVWSFSTGSTQLQAGRWYHVAATYQDGVGTKLYLDGNLEDENTEDGRVPLGGAGGRKLGHQGVVNEYFDGALDEVRIWNKAKDITEIRNESLIELVGNEGNLLAYYDFNQGIPTANNAGLTTLIDATANGYDGTLTSFTLDGNNSNWVLSESLDPTPNEPTDLFVTEVSDTRIDLNWTDNAWNETDFIIFRSDGNNTNFVQIGTSEADAPDYVDTSVTPGNGYFYRVLATDGTNNSIPSNEEFGSTLTPPGNALHFDALDDFIDVPDAASLDLSAAGTISAWINPSDFSNDGGRRRILMKQAFNGNETSPYQLMVDHLTGAVVFMIGDDVTLETLVGTSPAPLNQWTHVAATWDGTNLNIYFNGVLDATMPQSVTPAINNLDLKIGRYHNTMVTTVGRWSGMLDEISLWNTARTDVEIQNSMFSELVGNEANLVAYYPFNHGIGGGDNTSPLINTLLDKTANGNDGAFIGLDVAPSTNFALTGSTSNWVGSQAFNPFDPTDLFTTEVSSDQIDLSWTDNAINETGFTIERSDGNNDFSVPDATFAAAVDATTFSDNTVTAGNGYFYRVIANGASGDSGPSNEKFGSTITPPGNALEFDGVDDFVNLGTVLDSEFSGTDETFSIEGWIFPTSIDALGEAIVGKVAGSPCAADERQFSLILGADGTVRFTYYGTLALSQQRTFGGTSVLGLNQWHHIAVTYDGSIDTNNGLDRVKIFVNGLEESTIQLTSLGAFPYDIPAGPAPLALGANVNSSGNICINTDQAFSGRMDEVRIWDDVRSQGQLQSSLLSTLVGNEPNLIAYYRFDQDEATDLILPDRSTLNNNGTWSGNGGGVTTPQWILSGAPIDPPEIAVYSGADNTAPELFTGQPIPVNFGNAPQSTTLPLVFAIENTGVNDLTITDITTTGDFAVTTSTSFTVDAGSTSNFTVELLALSPGISNGNITIQSDDLDESTFVFPVTGTKGILIPKVYWTDETGTANDEIDRSDLTGANAQNAYYSGFSVDIQGIDVDTENNMVFWTNTDGQIRCGRIGPAGFVGTNTVLDESGGSAVEFYGIDVDGAAGKVYWCDAENGQIRRINFDGTSSEVLVSIGDPRDVELDVAGGKMYYVANPLSTPELWRANLDGSSPEMLLSSGTTFFEGIALDLINNHIYWTYSVGAISRSDLDGANQTFLSASVTEPQGIDVDPIGEMIYVVDGTDIIRISYQGVQESIQSGGIVTDPQDLALDARPQFRGGVLVQDYLALEALYNSTDGANWTDNTNWLTANPVSTWFGISVSGSRVSDIQIESNNLNGTLPPELGDMKGLTQLDLEDNLISGSIPPELGMITSLFELDLDNNQLTGSIPVELADITSLSDLTLQENQLTGPIPPELGTLINMFSLRLGVNQLSGNIPTELGDLTNLTTLGLNENQLTGSIPTELGNLVSLTVLELDRNQLTGSIPTELGNLTNLNYLEIHVNMFSGTIPVELGNLINLLELQLDRNQLTGSIPTQLGNLVNLLQLHLYDNLLTGTIPVEIGNLINLTDLELDQNQLTGSIPVELGNLVNLVDFDLHSNLLTGSIPTEIENLALLEVLDFNNNQLSGFIPTEVGNLTNLIDLILYSNQLTGSIPIELGNLTNLVDLDLSHNLLTGSIPIEMGSLALLTDLELDDNQLSGSIPTELGSLVLLDNLQLDLNQLTGTVPSSFASLISLTNLELNDNLLSDLPDLTSLSSLTAFPIFGNNFHFDDIEPNIGIAGITYSPQNTINTSDVNLNEGDDLDVTISVGGSSNQYQWFKDGSPVSGQTSDNLLIVAVVPSDAGSYHLEVTNTTATGLTISSNPFNVTVNGNPTVVTQDITVSLDATGNVSITPAQIDNGSSDDVTIQANLILGLDVTDFDCTDIGVNTVTLTVTDEVGNSSNGTASVTVVDDQSPTVATQDITVSLDAAGNVSILASEVDNGSSDNCLVNSIALDVTDFDCTNIGANTVTLTVTDVEGNSANGTATVTVLDDIDPVAVAMDITIQLDASDQATITAADIDDGSSDNCPFTLSLDVTTFGITEIGANTVTLTATDGSGNFASTTATVTVLGNNQAPTLSYTFYLDENSPDGTLLGAVVATDPEGDPLTYTILSGNTNDAFALGSSTGELTVNSSTALDFETTPVFNLVVQADDGNGGISMVDITVNLIDIIDENPLGIGDLEEQVSVYPNPTHERLFVELQAIPSNNLAIELFTMSGSQVLTTTRILSQTSNLIEIDLEELNPGIYLLKISNENEMITQNILVK